MRKSIIALLATVFVFWLGPFDLQAAHPVVFTPPHNGFSNATKIQTNHQGEHVIDRCYVELDADRLMIHFPMNAAYHLQLSFAVKGREFQSTLYWQPVSPERVENKILSQKLYLNREKYGTGDVLRGYVELEFSSWVVGEEAGEAVNYYVNGPFFGVVRPVGFDPLLDSNIATYTQTVAEMEIPMLNDAYTLRRERNDDCWLAERMDGYDLGWPAECYNNQLQAVRNIFLKSDAVKKDPDSTALRELTWDINSSAPFGDGPERLTIWFAEQDGEWKQLGFKKWFYNYCPE